MFERKRATHNGLVPLRPLWGAVGFPLLLIALESTPLAPNFVFVMMGIPALFLIWIIFGIWAAILTVGRLRLQAWQGAMTNAVLPLVVLVASLNFWSFIHFCNDAGDIVRFLTCRPLYLREIRATPADGAPRLVVVNLGGMIWSSRGYVYDEGDEILRDGALRSPAWKARAQNTELACGFHAQPFPGHFKVAHHWYLASFSC